MAGFHNDEASVIAPSRTYHAQISEETTVPFNNVQSCYNETNLELVFLTSLIEYVPYFEVLSTKLGW